MTFDLKIPDNIVSQPKITVVGIGGAGGNAINNMISLKIDRANFIAANTDAQALENSQADIKIQLGASITQGLGAGASPKIGKEAAEESKSEIKEALSTSNIVFITAGMGGGTGTGSSPVIAKIAKEMGIFIIGVVTKPFLFEGSRRTEIAEEGLKSLAPCVDSLIIIPNQNLFKLAKENTSFSEAFKLADNILYSGIKGITDLITMPGLINLDFADLKSIMSNSGQAMMSSAEAEGNERAKIAAENVINNPLLNINSIRNAKNILINITGGKDITLFEIDEATNIIRNATQEKNVRIIFGSVFDEKLLGKLKITIVATGINNIIEEKTNNKIESNSPEQKINKIEDIYDIPAILRKKY